MTSTTIGRRCDNCLLGETTTLRLKKRYLTKSGDVVHARVSGWAIRSVAGLVTHAVAAIQDVTAQQTTRARTGRLRRARGTRCVIPFPLPE